MLEGEIEPFVSQLCSNKEVESIMAFPHPLTAGGLVLVLADETADLLHLLALAYRHRPRGRSLYCLRRREMGQLSSPGVFAPPHHVNEYPHLPYWLRRKGQLLYGRDYRSCVSLPGHNARSLLFCHLEGCRESLRRYGILPALMGQQYEWLASRLAQEVRHVMATALLIHDQWDVCLDHIAEQFGRAFPDAVVMSLWREMQGLVSQIGAASPGRAEDIARETVWLFENFLMQMEKHASCH